MFNKNTLGKIDPSDSEQIEGMASKIFHEMFEEGKSIQEILDVNEGALEELYSLAYGFYNQGKYKESHALFQLLTGTKPDGYKYLLGLAASLHQLEEYDQAIMSFFLALNIEPENPVPVYYIADCFLKQNLNKEAIPMLDIVIEMAKEEHSTLKERCILIKKNLELNS